MEYEIAVLGAGPAGLSAAIAARSRGRSVLVLGNPPQDSPLARAERIDNYAGLPGLTGLELLRAMEEHALNMGALLRTGRVAALMDYGGRFGLTAGSDVFLCGALVLAPGVTQGTPLPGEAELLGRGVSYCATCDGMLFRGRRVMVAGSAKDAPEEANFLHKIGCRVTFVSPARPEELAPGVEHIAAKKLEIVGTDRVAALRADGQEVPCEGVFLLRPGVAPARLLPGLKTEGGAVAVDRRMATNLPGVFAAGDCTGRPYQVAKAVGEGLVAGENAAEYLDHK